MLDHSSQSTFTNHLLPVFIFLLFLFSFQLHSAKRFVEGYHINIRDMSSKDPHFDVVTLSGGGTRSHTLSDLRPDTKYSIFLLPYHQHITGNPSNLKIVSTKEDGK